MSDYDRGWTDGYERGRLDGQLQAAGVINSATDDLSAWCAGIETQVGELRHQRDHYRERFEELDAIVQRDGFAQKIMEYWKWAKKEFDDSSAARDDGTRTLLAALESENAIPIVGAIYSYICTAIDTVKTGYTKEIQRVSTDGHLPDAGQRPDVWLLEIERVRITTLLDKLYKALAVSITLMANDPRILCFQVVKECKVYGEPQLETLNRLTDWIKVTLEDRPSAATAQKGLTLAFKFTQANMKQAQFAANFGIDARQLRVYCKWWTQITEQATSTSEELKALISDYKK